MAKLNTEKALLCKVVEPAQEKTTQKKKSIKRYSTRI